MVEFRCLSGFETLCDIPRKFAASSQIGIPPGEQAQATPLNSRPRRNSCTTKTPGMGL